MKLYKPNNYTENETQIFLLARALAHPARVRMIEILKRAPYRNTDFSLELNLAPSTVKGHIDMLRDAKLIETEYFIHYYTITLRQERLNDLSAIMA